MLDVFAKIHLGEPLEYGLDRGVPQLGVGIANDGEACATDSVWSRLLGHTTIGDLDHAGG